MSIITGGDVKEIAFTNKGVGSGFFFPIAGEDSTLDTGGFRVADPLQIDGALRAIRQMNKKPWSFECPVSNSMDDTQDVELASLLAGSLDETIWTITYENGAVYKGNGCVVGDLALNGNKSQFTLKLQGSGVLGQ